MAEFGTTPLLVRNLPIGGMPPMGARRAANVRQKTLSTTSSR
jgi:hypothetical protein